MPRLSPPLPATFGILPDGRAVTHWTLRGPGGLMLECLDYGGIVTRLLVPDREGRAVDVVLGCDTLEGYLAPHPYFGAIAGRVAGRITGARFTLDGREHRLAANHGPNHLHGGLRGFDKQLWSALPVSRPDGAPSLRLSRISPDGEEGYPGEVAVSVTYTVTADNTFLIETEARASAATPFSLTHHSYFNLAGEGSGDIADHTLQILADAYAPADADMGLLGRRDPVTPANALRSPRRLGDVIPGLHQHHGDLYFLPPSPAPRLAAVLDHPPTRRRLAVTTDEACLQFYTGAHFDGSLLGKSGRPYHRHAGLCLECEGYPDAPNSPALGDITLRPGQLHRRSTAYSFSNY